MKVILLDHTQNPSVKIGEMASICYDSDKSPDACKRRARHCKSKGHLATMRFAYATFNVAGISRVCSHQIVRIAHAGILQRSQRYCSESRVEFVMPESFGAMSDKVNKFYDESRRLYNELVSEGVRKEDARYVIPQAAHTELNLCLNFQGWQDFLKNRTHKSAQWEVRSVAVEIGRQLHEIAPELF